MVGSLSIELRTEYRRNGASARQLHLCLTKKTAFETFYKQPIDCGMILWYNSVNFAFKEWTGI
jgi:hypothetical protein